MAALNSVKNLLVDELKDLYSAEKQLTVALPKMQKGSSEPELSEAFSSHLAETRGQISRLEAIAEKMEIKLTGKKCKAMEELIAEGSEALEEDGDETIIDIGVTGAARRVEHYQMAGYQCAIALAEQLGMRDVVELLNQTLKEEVATDNKMRDLGKKLALRSNQTSTENKPKQMAAAK